MLEAEVGDGKGKGIPDGTGALNQRAKGTWTRRFALAFRRRRGDSREGIVILWIGAGRWRFPAECGRVRSHRLHRSWSYWLESLGDLRDKDVGVGLV